MEENPIKPDATLQQPEYVGDETQPDQYTVDNYPYATRGLLWGFLFSILFWVSAIAILMLVF